MFQRSVWSSKKLIALLWPCNNPKKAAGPRELGINPFLIMAFWEKWRKVRLFLEYILTTRVPEEAKKQVEYKYLHLLQQHFISRYLWKSILRQINSNSFILACMQELVSRIFFGETEFRAWTVNICFILWFEIFEKKFGGNDKRFTKMHYWRRAVWILQDDHFLI